VQRRKVFETDRFTAESDSGGRVTVIETTTFNESVSFEGSARTEGLKRYETTRGERLNVIGPGTFQTMTGMTYRRLQEPFQTQP
jgi:hypothetical protein